MSDKEYISPTDEMRDVLEKQIMQEIYPIIKAIEKDEEYSKSVKRIFSAIQTAKFIEKRFNDDFRKSNPDKEILGAWPDLMHIVASCIAFSILGSDDAETIKDYAPCSDIGWRIMAFANAALLLDATSRLQGCFDFEVGDYEIENAQKYLMDNLKAEAGCSALFQIQPPAY